MEDELMNLDEYPIDLEQSAPKEKATLTKVKDLVEVIGKISIGIVALCYVLGLIVVNLYLSRYGVYSLNLFRLNYITAGAWLLILINMGILLILTIAAIGYSFGPIRRYIHKKIESPLYEEEKVHFTQKHAGLFVLQSAFLALIVLISIKNLGIDFNKIWIGEIALSIFMILSVIWGLILLNRSTSSLRFPRSLPIFLYSILLLIALILDFARNLYGTIPPYLGGGGTKTIQLLLKLEDKDKHFFQSSGIEFCDNSNQTQMLNLLYSTDNEYVILVNSQTFPEAKGSTLSIKKDLIQAVLYEGRREQP